MAEIPRALRNALAELVDSPTMRFVIAELDQAVHDSFDYYKSKGEWDSALDVMQEAADRNPDVFGSSLEQALVEYRFSWHTY